MCVCVERAREREKSAEREKERTLASFPGRQSPAPVLQITDSWIHERVFAVIASPTPRPEQLSVFVFIRWLFSRAMAGMLEATVHRVETLDLLSPLSHTESLGTG